ncbi:MAG TPA: hypothetical protein VGR29_06830 [Thermomicrobiales bacterium]|nr:hypothetical protein [Thermomicrobiales bacterium]
MTLHTRVHPRTSLLLAALLPALATAAASIPHVLNTPEEGSPAQGWLMLSIAPLVALLVNGRWPAATNVSRAFLVALPQLLVVISLARLDVWLDVRSGYLLRNSGEEAMAYGIGTTLGVIMGIVLVVLVASAGRLGALLAE